MTITLKAKTLDGTDLIATFLPDEGMRLYSFKHGDLEVIEQSIASSLVGPYYGRRNPRILPSFPEIIPHKEGEDPFLNGIGPHIAWKYESSESTVRAAINGKEEWNGVLLSKLQGQNFKYLFNASLTSDGLKLILSTVSDTDSLAGIQYSYRLPKGYGTIAADIREQPEMNQATIDIQQPCDSIYHPYINPCIGRILLDTGAYCLQTEYRCASAENCWRLFRPTKGDYVTIGPMSADNPLKPCLTVTTIEITLQIIPSS